MWANKGLVVHFDFFSGLQYLGDQSVTPSSTEKTKIRLNDNNKNDNNNNNKIIIIMAVHSCLQIA